MTALYSLLSWLRQRYHPLWRLRRMRWFCWLQNHCDLTVPVRSGAVTFYVYLLRDLTYLLPHRGMEQMTATAFEAVLERFAPDCFLDVGANVGSYSWRVATRRPAAVLWLFEPDPSNQRLLRKTLRRLGRPDVVLHADALSDRTAEAPFLVDDASGAVGSLVDLRGTAAGYNLHDSYALRRLVTVATRRLDDHVAALLGKRVLIKVDVEGAEELVFAGARETLRTVRPVIFFESFELRKASALTAAGYRLFSCEEGANYVAVQEEHRELIAGLGLGEVEILGV